jgi:hypothetical protein
MTTTTATPIISKQFEMEVKEGLIFILNHLGGLYPRTISTYATGGRQRLVNNFAEAMAFFKAANFLDCRISAYPKYTDYYVNKTGIAPSVLLVDIDKEHFIPEEFELTATRTYSNFHNVLGSRPTQLWTGGGYHFIQPQSVPVIERIEDFQKFDQSSRRFLQFEEQLLTDGKGDQSHWSTVSFNNMQLRVPCSLNSKLVQFDGGRIIDIPYDARVRIEKYWDGNTPTVGRVLLMQYYTRLQFAAIRDIREQRVREVQYRKYRHIYGRARECINLHGYDYIEKLLNKPLDDFRKFCIWKIFVPYFINVKRLPRLEGFNRTKSWLDRCNSISRLNFNPACRIEYAINNVGTFPPTYQDRLEYVNKLFYERLKKEGII